MVWQYKELLTANTVNWSTQVIEKEILASFCFYDKQISVDGSTKSLWSSLMSFGREYMYWKKPNIYLCIYGCSFLSFLTKTFETKQSDRPRLVGNTRIKRGDFYQNGSHPQESR